MRHEERFSYVLDLCLIVVRHTERGVAQSLRSETPTGQGEQTMTTNERRKILLENIAKNDTVSERYYGEEDRKILEELKREGLVSCEPTPGRLNWFTVYPNTGSKC